MEMDYINELPRNTQETNGDSQQTGRRQFQVLFLSFGLLCILEAVLNVSLRLTLYYGKEWTHSDCNITNGTDNNPLQNGDQMMKHCNKLQERFNALTKDKNQLENQVSVLNNQLRNEQKEKNELQKELNDRCPATNGCQRSWTQIGGRCYFLSSEEKSWVESRNFCQREGGDLVVINNKEEQRALSRLDNNNELILWIGLDGRNGNFVWVDGSAVTPFWQDGQPDDGGGNITEDCVEMDLSKPVFNNWNDEFCESKRRWLCEEI